MTNDELLVLVNNLAEELAKNFRTTINDRADNLSYRLGDVPGVYTVDGWKRFDYAVALAVAKKLES
jgi:hypothetical protein